MSKQDIVYSLHGFQPDTMSRLKEVVDDAVIHLMIHTKTGAASAEKAISEI